MHLCVWKTNVPRNGWISPNEVWRVFGTLPLQHGIAQVGTGLQIGTWKQRWTYHMSFLHLPVPYIFGTTSCQRSTPGSEKIGNWKMTDFCLVWALAGCCWPRNQLSIGTLGAPTSALVLRLDWDPINTHVILKVWPTSQSLTFFAPKKT